MSKGDVSAASSKTAQKLLCLLSDLSYGRSPIDVLAPNRTPSFLEQKDLIQFESILRAQARLFGTSITRDETFAWVQALTVHPATLRFLHRHGFLYGSFFMVRTGTGRVEIPEVEHGLHSVRLTALFPDTLRKNTPMQTVVTRFLDFYDAFVAACMPGDDIRLAQGRDLLIDAMQKHFVAIPSEKHNAFVELLLDPSSVKRHDRIQHNSQRAWRMRKLLFGDSTGVNEERDNWLCLVIAIGHLTNFLIRQAFASVPATMPWSVRCFTEGMSDTSWFEKQLNVIINEPGEVAAVLLWDILNGVRVEEQLFAYGFIDRISGGWGPAAHELGEWLTTIAQVFPDQYSDLSSFYFGRKGDIKSRATRLSSALHKHPESASNATATFENAIGGLLTCATEKGLHHPCSRFSLFLQKVLRHEFIGDHAYGNSISRGYAFIPLSPTSRVSVSRNRFYWFTAASLNIDFSLFNASALANTPEDRLAEYRKALDPLTLIVSSLESGVKEPFFRDKLPDYIREVSHEQNDHFTQKDLDYTQQCLTQAAEDLASTEKQKSACFLRWYTFGLSSRRHRQDEAIHPRKNFCVSSSVMEALSLFNDFRLVCDGRAYNRLDCRIDSSVIDMSVSGCEQCFVIAVVELVRNAAEASLSPYGTVDDGAPRVIVTLDRAPCGHLRLMVSNRVGGMPDDLRSIFNGWLTRAIDADQLADLVPMRERTEAEAKDTTPRNAATENHGGTGILRDVANMVCCCNVESAEYSVLESGTVFTIVFNETEV